MTITIENATITPTTFNSITRFQSHQTAPIYLFCCALSLASISAFLRAGFVLKFFTMLSCICSQGAVLWSSNLYNRYEMDLKYVFLLICVHIQYNIYF